MSALPWARAGILLPVARRVFKVLTVGALFLALAQLADVPLGNAATLCPQAVGFRAADADRSRQRLDRLRVAWANGTLELSIPLVTVSRIAQGDLHSGRVRAGSRLYFDASDPNVQAAFPSVRSKEEGLRGPFVFANDRLFIETTVEGLHDGLVRLGHETGFPFTDSSMSLAFAEAFGHRGSESDRSRSLAIVDLQISQTVSGSRSSLIAPDGRFGYVLTGRDKQSGVVVDLGELYGFLKVRERGTVFFDRLAVPRTFRRQGLQDLTTSMLLEGDPKDPSVLRPPKIAKWESELGWTNQREFLKGLIERMAPDQPTPVSDPEVRDLFNRCCRYEARRGADGTWRKAISEALLATPLGRLLSLFGFTENLKIVIPEDEEGFISLTSERRGS